MAYLKNVGFSLIFNFGFIFVFNLFLTVLSYIDVINNGFFVFLMLFSFIFSYFLGGLLLCKRYSKKGYLD